MMSTNLKDVMTRKKAAAFLGVSRQRVAALIDSGELQTVALDGQLLVMRESAKARKKSNPKSGPKKKVSK